MAATRKISLQIIFPKLRNVRKQRRVVIEHKDFENLIKVYDRPGALFYCDPPYHKTEKYYDVEFNDFGHERLNACLQAIKGRFVISYNNDEYVREMYNDFNITTFSRQNNLNRLRLMQ